MEDFDRHIPRCHTPPRLTNSSLFSARGSARGSGHGTHRSPPDHFWRQHSDHRDHHHNDHHAQQHHQHQYPWDNFMDEVFNVHSRDAVYITLCLACTFFVVFGCVIVGYVFESTFIPGWCRVRCPVEGIFGGHIEAACVNGPLRVRCHDGYYVSHQAHTNLKCRMIKNHCIIESEETVFEPEMKVCFREYNFTTKDIAEQALELDKKGNVTRSVKSFAINHSPPLPWCIEKTLSEEEKLRVKLFGRYGSKSGQSWQVALGLLIILLCIPLSLVSAVFFIPMLPCSSLP